MGKYPLIKGTVAEGNRLGNKLGFPTANIRIGNTTDIQNGVYAAEVKTPFGPYRAMVNIGTRPTVTDGGERYAEAHLFGFDGNLYGLEITIEPTLFIRDEKVFTSVEDLKNQIEKDKNHILKNE